MGSSNWWGHIMKRVYWYDTLLKKRCYIYRKGGSDLIWGGFSKSLQRRRIQFPVLDPAKLTPSIKTSRRYIGSHINHSTLSSSDKAQSHPLSSTFIHFIHCPGPFVATCQPQVLVELPSPCQGESVCFTTFIHFHPFSLAVPSCTWRSIQSQVLAIRGMGER